MDAAFNSLLLAARAEALTLLRALLRADADTPPALLRERRLAACAILKVNPAPLPLVNRPNEGTPHAQPVTSSTEPGRAAPAHSRTPPRCSRPPFPSEPNRAPRPTAPLPNTKANHNRAPPPRALARPLAQVGADSG